MLQRNVTKRLFACQGERRKSTRSRNAECGTEVNVECGTRSAELEKRPHAKNAKGAKERIELGVRKSERGMRNEGGCGKRNGKSKLTTKDTKGVGMKDLASSQLFRSVEPCARR